MQNTIKEGRTPREIHKRADTDANVKSVTDHTNPAASVTYLRKNGQSVCILACVISNRLHRIQTVNGEYNPFLYFRVRRDARVRRAR